MYLRFGWWVQNGEQHARRVGRGKGFFEAKSLRKNLHGSISSKRGIVRGTRVSNTIFYNKNTSSSDRRNYPSMTLTIHIARSVVLETMWGGGGVASMVTCGMAKLALRQWLVGVSSRRGQNALQRPEK